MLIFLLILIVILIFPIRLKLSICFIDNKLQIYIYKFKLYPRKIKKNINPINSVDEKNVHNTNIKNYKKKKDKKKFNINIKKLFFSLINNKIKPKLKIEMFINYSLGDAAHTAQIFGIINSFSYTGFEFLNLFIKIKSPKISITPIFNSTISLNSKINSILYINLAQIIYIAILVFKNIKRKGGVPLRETYGK